MTGLAAPVRSSISNTVGVPCHAWHEMECDWKLVDALLNWTDDKLGMRLEEWLPRNQAESEEAWQRRRKRTVLFNAYEDSLTNIVARPFSREVSIDGNLDPRLERFRTVTDSHGSSLGDFERRMFFEGLHRGLVHGLVDLPADTDGTASIGREIRNRTGPYQVVISARDMIGWRSRDHDNGEKQLTQIRFIERREIPDPTDDYCTISAEFIRVINDDGRWEVWEPILDANQIKANLKTGAVAGSKQWKLVAEGEHDYPDGIPIDTVYFNKTGFMTARPVLRNLAWVNLLHFQRDSGLNTVLSVLDCPILFGAGFDDDKAFVISVNKAITSKDPAAKLNFVEHSGEAIKAAMAYIDKLEERMERYGLRPLQMNMPQTARAAGIAEGRNVSDAQTWAMRQKASLRRRVEIAHRWLNLDVPEDIEVNLFTDFEAIGPMAATDMEHIQKMRERGDVTRLTMLDEGHRRGMFGPNFDPKTEDAEAEADTQRREEMALAQAAAAVARQREEVEPDEEDQDAA